VTVIQGAVEVRIRIVKSASEWVCVRNSKLSEFAVVSGESNSVRWERCSVIHSGSSVRDDAG
jgi:hypothetical protein